MLIRLHTTAEIVNVLGGNGPTAKLTMSAEDAADPAKAAKAAKAVTNWKKAETFPSNTYVAMTRALRERGYEAPDTLWGMKMPEEASS